MLYGTTLTADDLLVHLLKIVMHLRAVCHHVSCRLPLEVRASDFDIGEVEVFGDHVDHLVDRNAM